MKDGNETELTAKVRASMYRGCLTMREAAKKAGMPYGTFHGIVGGYHRPGKKAVVKIARFLGVSRGEAMAMRDEPEAGPKEDQAGKK